MFPSKGDIDMGICIVPRKHLLDEKKNIPVFHPVLYGFKVWNRISTLYSQTQLNDNPNIGEEFLFGQEDNPGILLVKYYINTPITTDIYGCVAVVYSSRFVEFCHNNNLYYDSRNWNDDDLMLAKLSLG